MKRLPALIILLIGVASIASALSVDEPENAGASAIASVSAEE